MPVRRDNLCSCGSIFCDSHVQCSDNVCVVVEVAVAGIRSCNSCSAGGDSDCVAVTKDNSVAFTEEACIHTCMYICFYMQLLVMLVVLMVLLLHVPASHAGLDFEANIMQQILQ